LSYASGAVALERKRGQNRLARMKCQGRGPGGSSTSALSERPECKACEGARSEAYQRYVAATRDRANAIGLFRQSRAQAKRQPGEGAEGNLPSAFPDCLFPRKQGVTGMNPTAFPASLTGRIWFFCRTTDQQICIFGLL